MPPSSRDDPDHRLILSVDDLPLLDIGKPFGRGSVPDDPVAILIEGVGDRAGGNAVEKLCLPDGGVLSVGAKRIRVGPCEFSLAVGHYPDLSQKAVGIILEKPLAWSIGRPGGLFDAPALRVVFVSDRSLISTLLFGHGVNHYQPFVPVELFFYPGHHPTGRIIPGLLGEQSLHIAGGGILRTAHPAVAVCFVLYPGDLICCVYPDQLTALVIGKAGRILRGSHHLCQPAVRIVLLVQNQLVAGYRHNIFQAADGAFRAIKACVDKVVNGRFAEPVQRLGQIGVEKLSRLAQGVVIQNRLIQGGLIQSAQD